MTTNRDKAVVLLSGGLDSATVLAMAKAEGFQCYALSFDYGQRHRFELDAALAIAEDMRVEWHHVIKIDMTAMGGSALTADIDVPKSHDDRERVEQIPITYVPARNTIFLSHALAWAEVLEAADIFIGVNAIDYSGYPDCRLEFIESFEKMANLATKAAVEGNLRIHIRTPLIHLSKSEIIQEGYRLGVDYGRTHSCYDPSPEGLACGQCDSCRFRRKGFRDAGIVDPTRYIS